MGGLCCTCFQNGPEKLAPLISYFLIVAKAHRDIPGKGWMEYDRAFRKQAADNVNLSWSVMDPTLYLSTVLTRGAHNSAPKPQNQSQVPTTVRKDQVCYNWNSGSCSFPRCKFKHVCSKCEGNHRRLSCERWDKAESGKVLELCLHERGHSIPAEWVAHGLDWLADLPAGS